MSKLPQPTALILGASGAIGSQIADKLHKEQYTLFLHGQNKEKTERLANELGAKAIVADLLSPESTETIISSLGKTKPVLVIHSAGGPLPKTKFISTLAHWEATFRLNLWNVLELNERLVQQHPEGSSLNIVHISSSSARHAKGCGAYGAAKAALNHYIKSQAKGLLNQNVYLSGLMPAIVHGKGNRWDNLFGSNPDQYQDIANQQYIGQFQTAEEIAVTAIFLSKHPELAGCVLNLDANT